MLVTLFQTTPSCVVAEPNQIAVFIGHVSWDADFGRSGSSGFVAGFVVGIVAVERNTTKIV